MLRLVRTNFFGSIPHQKFCSSFFVLLFAKMDSEMISSTSLFETTVLQNEYPDCANARKHVYFSKKEHQDVYDKFFRNNVISQEEISSDESIIKCFIRKVLKEDICIQFEDLPHNMEHPQRVFVQEPITDDLTGTFFPLKKF